MIHSVYFLTDVASVTNQPLLLLQFLIYLDGWLITIFSYYILTPAIKSLGCSPKGKVSPQFGGPSGREDAVMPSYAAA